MKGIKYIITLNHTMTVLLDISIVHYNNYFPQIQIHNITINIYFELSYYAGIILNAFHDPSCSKLCWHNRWVSSYSNYNNMTT